MYLCNVMEEEEERISKDFRFDNKVSDKAYVDFFRDRVITLTGVFHAPFEQRKMDKIPEPFSRYARRALRKVAKLLIRESEDCRELNRLLDYLIVNGGLEKSKREMARLAFILCFIGDH